jgi:hypothetical protein
MGVPRYIHKQIASCNSLPSEGREGILAYGLTPNLGFGPSCVRSFGCRASMN